MEFQMNSLAGQGYASASQRIRVITEQWVKDNIFCPNCCHMICGFENNRPVADFFCDNCHEEFELKSKANKFGNRITDGAYKTMLERLKSENNPNLFLLGYNKNMLTVDNLFVVPKHFFKTDIIEQRKPLKETARRAGWIGCNILLSNIPEKGKIFYIRGGKQVPKEEIANMWKNTLFLRDAKGNEKGWLIDIMLCIDSIGRKEFLLNDIYSFEVLLSRKHPENKHIRAKIRQQLQVLRDRDYLQFAGRGKYRLK